MKDSFIKFQLADLNKVKAMIFTNAPRPDTFKFILFKEGEEPVTLKILKSTSVNSVSLFDLALPSPYEFGKEYSIILSNFSAQPIDVSEVPTFKEFDDLFNYSGNDLGATYYIDHTDFVLWAPLASSVELKIYHNKELNIYKMNRTAKGVYRLTVDGNLLNARYVYIVRNSGVSIETTDPYAKGTSTNSRWSGVVDTNYIKELGNIKPKNKINNYVDAIIYEVGIRDFTEQNSDATNIKYKGKYLGFVEEGRKTKGGHPAGLDYLSYIGVTHVQLNPIIDFGSVDDEKTDSKYNWGYDPISMFALEGSYSIHPEIPMERLIEFKTLVNKLHERDIRVIVDVVYNHIYEHLSSCYEKTVPNYFFRRRHDGLSSNASGCGDDVASERYMVRKMINDSMKYFIEVFDIDGYRFDLMGLLDIKTVKKGFELCKEIKDDIMMYGEGWNMGLELPYEEKACTDNADKLPMFGFFNETVRDIAKGPTFRDSITQKGYINGDLNYAYGLRHILFGSTIDVNYQARFKDANQSINYVECHDNNTIFDKLTFSNPDEDIVTLLKRIRLANGLIGTMFGVAFYHMGQEIGLSKAGNDNTYNVLDINKMNWNLIDERFDMVNTFADIISLRKRVPLYRLHTREELQNVLDIQEYEGTFIYTTNNPHLISGYDKYMVIYNPQDKAIPFNLDSDYYLVFSSNSGLSSKKDIMVKDFLISPISLTILVKGVKNG